MQNEYRISFYHPKACQPETTPILHHNPTPTHAHAHTTGSNYTPNKLGVCYDYSPLYITSYHSYILRTCIVAGRGILGVFGVYGEIG